eukprot:scaffold11132_cov54-Phaeocystis_antarctica.AAC.1
MPFADSANVGAPCWRILSPIVSSLNRWPIALGGTPAAAVPATPLCSAASSAMLRRGSLPVPRLTGVPAGAAASVCAGSACGCRVADDPALVSGRLSCFGRSSSLRCLRLGWGHLHLVGSRSSSRQSGQVWDRNFLILLDVLGDHVLKQLGDRVVGARRRDRSVVGVDEPGGLCNLLTLARRPLLIAAINSLQDLRCPLSPGGVRLLGLLQHGSSVRVLVREHRVRGLVLRRQWLQPLAALAGTRGQGHGQQQEQHRRATHGALKSDCLIGKI